DGTEQVGGQDPGICAALNCDRVQREVALIAGMRVAETRMTLRPEQVDFLRDLCAQADIVLIPLPVLMSLREQGVRDTVPNALAMNATPETMRSPPSDKVVDLQNWS